MENKCPECGQHKFVSKRLYYMLIGFAAAGCGVWLLIIPPIGLLTILFGLITFFAGIFANGRICTNCQYKSLPA